MVGDRWAEVKALFAAIDVGSLRNAADDWGRIASAADAVVGHLDQDRPDRVIEKAGALGQASYRLSFDAKLTNEFVGRIAEQARSPQQILLDLVQGIEDLKSQMAAEETGPLGTGAFPDTSIRTATPAGAVVRDLLLQAWDEKADHYRGLLRVKVSNTAGRLEVAISAGSPNSVPQSDPEGPRPTG